MYPQAPPGMLLEHFWYISDSVRLNAYRDALHRQVKPGDTVLDLGCGTGVLGLLALQAGAERVIAVDASKMITVAREIAKTNDLSSRIEHHHIFSTDLELDSPVDLAICDQIGAIGWDAGVNRYFADAEDRGLIRPGGVLIPGRTEMVIAPVSAPACREPVDAWTDLGPGLDLSSVGVYVRNRALATIVEANSLLAAPKAVDDRLTNDTSRIDATATFTIERDDELTGMLGMARAWVDEDASFSNIPGAADQSKRWQIHLPSERSHPVKEGDEITLTLSGDLSSGRQNWSFELQGSSEFSSNHSTFLGKVLSPGDL